MQARRPGSCGSGKLIMVERTATDRQLSVEGSEFLWDTEGRPESHGYLLAPVLELLKQARAKTVLDLGCGNGAFADELSRHGMSVAGLDHSESGVTLARARYTKIAFAQHDLGLPLPAAYIGQYDAVVSVEVIEHLLLPRLLLRNASDALRPGGLVILTTPYHGYLKNLAIALCGGFDAHWHPLRDYGHIKFFSSSTLRALIEECGFSSLGVTTAGRIPPFAKSMVIAGVKSS
jgi:2-polyprenyl-6-hydroxyphenyl methylase/3-demethylubiquinone-9 3-methyltransferase